ncbi:hypothetical protein EV146_11098 [Mesobacillus foraminis]|uniref:Uncharacterized protein n=1 Tax=Mesobacillus foraminis TaxID=279826 RepID=A0A4R2B8F3_9BACI|nr:hypothetical protein EV146_11098 [Mesobacillus foraminis]
MVISIKNHLKDGVDLDCFNILNPYLPNNWAFRRELNKQEIELLRLLRSVMAFYSIAMNGIPFGDKLLY